MTVYMYKFTCAFMGFVLETMGKLCNMWMLHMTQCNNRCEL